MNLKKDAFRITFHCFFPDDTTPVRKTQDLKLSEIPKWVEAYKFTHPNCEAVSIKVWFHDEK